MLTNLRRNLNTKYFDWRARGVLRTAPVTMDPDAAFSLVTQLCSRDVVMYLVAVKSFSRLLRPRKVYVVGDRLQPDEIALLESHVEGLEVRDIKTVDAGACPRGGCWERLLTIIDVSAHDYVIQLDADTITFSTPHEVLRCVQQGTGFTLGTKMGKEAIPVAQARAAVLQLVSPDAHVQVLTEANFDKLEGAENLRYIRGNAAFAGFPPGQATRAAAESFSLQMEAALGSAKWREWGSEQVASNFLVANTHEPIALPFERYRYFAPQEDLSACAFLHYVGTYRFAGGVYARTADDVVRELSSAAAA